MLALGASGAFAQSPGSTTGSANDSGAGVGTLGGGGNDPFGMSGAPAARYGDDSANRGPSPTSGPRAARDCAEVGDPYSVDEDFAAQMREDCLAEQDRDGAGGSEDSTTFNEGLGAPGNSKA
ncbi:MAG: hypothetical protein ACREQF_07520, partial [Candidatus Binataceae bacterium]